MNYDKLIETLRQHGVSCVRAHGRYCSICDEAATALSTLQAENKRLNKIVCSIPTTPDSGRTVSQYDKEMSMCAYLDDLEAENEKLRAELEQVKRERDAAVRQVALISQPNEPLTLEQLRQMDGRPVWIVDVGPHKWYGPCWAIVERDNCLARTAKNWNPVFFERYGERWLAYRRPPEGEA